MKTWVLKTTLSGGLDGHDDFVVSDVVGLSCPPSALHRDKEGGGDAGCNPRCSVTIKMSGTLNGLHDFSVVAIHASDCTV